LFKRQTPVGPHINDFVSFRERLFVDVLPPSESQEAATARSERHAWLKERDYRVVTIRAADIAADAAAVLDSLAAVIAGPL